MTEIQPPDIETFYSKVAGVSKRNSYKTSRQKIIREDVFVGSVLILKREPDNKYDPNAVAVYVEALDGGIKQIGYLNQDVARQAADEMDNGHFVGAIVTDVTGGTEDKETQGVNIQVVFADEPVDMKKVTGVKGKGFFEALFSGLFGGGR